MVVVEVTVSYRSLLMSWLQVWMRLTVDQVPCAAVRLCIWTYGSFMGMWVSYGPRVGTGHMGLLWTPQGILTA